MIVEKIPHYAAGAIDSLKRGYNASISATIPSAASPQFVP